MTTTIVPGLRLRPYAGEPDLAEIARIENAEAEADQLPERVTVDGLAAEYGHPSASFDPARDVTIAELDGQAVAYGLRNWVDTTDGLREYRVDGSVHPAWRRRGIGTAMLTENERLQRTLAASHATPNAKVIGSWSGETQAADIALLQAAEFMPVRWFFEMTRPTLDDIPELPLPDGLEVRPITPALARRVWDADIEAFEDHWGGFDRSDVRDFTLTNRADLFRGHRHDCDRVARSNRATVAGCQSRLMSSTPSSRRMRSVNPAVAGTANAGVVGRVLSNSSNASAYANRSPQTLTARSSQQSSRSLRILAESHQTAGW